MRDLALVRGYADALFTYDQDGRILTSNEPFAPARRSAPKVYLGWSNDGFVVQTRDDVPEIVVQELSAAANPDTVKAHPYLSERTQVSDGLIYVFPEHSPDGGPTVMVTETNAALARETFPWLIEEAGQWGPCQGVVVDGQIVSICFSARIDRVSEIAGVETVDHARGHGYAGLATAAWARAVREAGKVPFYSTSKQNLASQCVARKLGLIQIGFDQSWD